MGGSSLDNDGTGRYCQTARVRQARRRGVRVQKPVVEPPQVGIRLEPGGSGPVGQCVGRFQDEGTDPVVDIAKVGAGVTVKDCGVAVARAAGEELGTDPVYRLVVNVGTVVGSPSCRPTGSVAARHAVC